MDGKELRWNPQTHDLKTWPRPFYDLVTGWKLAEVRVDDRGFVVGDILRLYEYEPESGKVTGSWTVFEVTHITTGFRLPSGTVVMSLGFYDEPIEPPDEVNGHRAERLISPRRARGRE